MNLSEVVRDRERGEEGVTGGGNGWFGRRTRIRMRTSPSLVGTYEDGEDSLVVGTVAGV